MTTSLGGAVYGVATEYFLCDQSEAVKIPSHLTYLEAATLPVGHLHSNMYTYAPINKAFHQIAYLTAWTALFKFEPKMIAGQTVLVMGTGGCSIATLQL